MIEEQNEKVAEFPSKTSSQFQETKVTELNEYLSNIIDYNERLSCNLEVNRELLEKETKSRLKIEKCCEKIEPKIVELCRGILVHLKKEAKNYSKEFYTNVHYC